MMTTLGSHTSATSGYYLLHKSIRNFDYKTMEELLSDEDVSLIWKSNSMGWTALHFAASHGLGTMERWTWFLQLATREGAREQLFMNLNDAGESPMVLFFQRELGTPFWRREIIKREAIRRRKYIEKALEDDEAIERIRKSMNPNITRQETSLASDTVVDFLMRLQVLLRAAVPSTQGQKWSLLHTLALTGCPRIVALLVMRLYPDQRATRDNNGNLPIHIAASSPSLQSYHILIAFAQTYPETCSQLDSCGHLPLHLALAAGTTGHTIACLWAAYPLYGAPRDPGSNLPAFLLAAVDNASARNRKTFQVASCRSMWRYLPQISQQRALDKARMKAELEELTTVHSVLRALPDALSSVLHH